MEAREPPWEQNGLPLMVNIMRVASAKSWSVRGASHQPAFMGSFQTIMLFLTWYGFTYRKVMLF